MLFLLPIPIFFICPNSGDIRFLLSYPNEEIFSPLFLHLSGVYKKQHAGGVESQENLIFKIKIRLISAMKLSKIYLVLIFLSSAQSYTSELKTQHVKFKKITKPGKSQTRLAKRDYISNGFVSYTVILEVGTPPQEIEVVIDTGSSDLWFQTAQSLQCSTSGSYSNFTSCDDLGIPYFKPSESVTLEYKDTEFLMSYVGGVEVTNGTFASDYVTIGDFTVKNQTFGIAYEANYQVESILGLGLEALEYSDTKYPTLLSSMYSEGLIDKKQYLIYLNSQFSDGGEITFGSIDTSKYTGELVAHDIVSQSEFYIQSEGVTFNGTQIMGSAQVLIDTGTTAMSVPTDTLRALVNSLNATFNNDYGHYGVVCEDYNTSAPDLIFKFGTQEIKIKPEEYLMNYNIGSNGETEPVKDDNGRDICFLGFDTSDDVILGDTFIRSVYAVFDLESLQISFAEPVWESDVISTKSVQYSEGLSTPSSFTTSLMSKTLFSSSALFPQRTTTTSHSHTETSTTKIFHSSSNSAKSSISQTFEINPSLPLPSNTSSNYAKPEQITYSNGNAKSTTAILGSRITLVDGNSFSKSSSSLLDSLSLDLSTAVFTLFLSSSLPKGGSSSLFEGVSLTSSTLNYTSLPVQQYADSADRHHSSIKLCLIWFLLALFS